MSRRQPGLFESGEDEAIDRRLRPSFVLDYRRLLAADGYVVESLVGLDGIRGLEHISEADLLVLAHSVPIEQKERALKLFKRRSRSPVLSLLSHHQIKIPEADYGVEAYSPAEFLDAVKAILRT